jgi:phosphoenolpyruvate-protein kinase (PTS system EI component)
MGEAATRREFRAEPGPPDDPGRASVVIGRLWHAGRTETGVGVSGVDPAAAVSAAFAAVPADLERLAAALRGQGLVEPAQIVEASVLMAGDPQLRALVDEAVASGAAPAAAVTQAAEHFAALLAHLDDPVLAGRAADVRAVGRRLVAALAGTDSTSASAHHSRSPGRGTGTEDGPRIVIGAEVTADDLLQNPASVAGAVSVVGGVTAHVGIVARSLGIPVLFGIDPALLDLPDGTEVMLDTRAGLAVMSPDARDRHRAEVESAALRARRTRLASARTGALSTRDGAAVVLLANVASAAEANLAVAMDAPGVGLLRTEMPFLTATGWPTYDEHVAHLRPVLQPLRGRPVTVRTLDFADDKLPPFLRRGRPGPLGPGLGIMLAEPRAFGAQLRAIIHCGLELGVAVSVMFPMVDSVATFQRCRALTTSAAADLGVDVPPVGAMVETREAVAVIEDLAAAVDFLSIGTNDLTATILGLNRRDPLLTPAGLREPAVHDAVARTVRAGRATGRSVSVCGDAASDPALVVDLLDLGCRTLSVAPSMMDEVRTVVREYHEDAHGRTAVG